MKIRILQNALACGQRFVEGEIIEVDVKTADVLIGAKLAVRVDETAADGAGETAGAETQTDGAGETAADKPKRGRGRNRGGANK